MNQKVLSLLLPVLVAAVLLLPAQSRLCLAAEAGQEIVLDDAAKEPVEEETSELSTPMMIGIGAGVAVLAGVAIAVGSSGGGDDDNGSVSPITPEPEPPPTSDQLVSAWTATGSQAGSGLTYSGYYQLFQGGGLAYDLWVSDGEHLVGGGGWSLSGYTLTLHTDHDSKYVGTVESGSNITSISLVADNTGWALTLSR